MVHQIKQQRSPYPHMYNNNNPSPAAATFHEYLSISRSISRFYNKNGTTLLCENALSPPNIPPKSATIVQSDRPFSTHVRSTGAVKRPPDGVYPSASSPRPYTTTPTIPLSKSLLFLFFVEFSLFKGQPLP